MKDAKGVNILIMINKTVPMILNEIKFIKDPIPTFRELTDNYSSGLISVPTFGEYCQN